MKKTILAVALLTTALAACSQPDNKATQPQSSTTEQTANVSTNNQDSHTTEHSLDWAGDYKGKLPCADCEGIQTELELDHDKTYTLKETYLGAKSDGQANETKGTFSFDPQNSSIVVLDKNADNRKFLIGENSATVLDLEGNKIESELANFYILQKQAH